MSRGGRIALIGAAATVLIVGFVVARDAGEDDDKDDTTTQAAEPQPFEPGDPIETTPKAKPKPPVRLIRTRDGKPTASVKRLNAEKGDTVKFTVSSNIPDEVHLHGYDVQKAVGPGKPARYSFDADIEGIFEIELHGTAAAIGTLKVEP
ncbi:MAG: hypothetical protein H0V29_11165 [Thermoleophilaceae bacterium]|nr:hypothetical protein [Thermoleophilaceae bacterium]